MRAADQSSRGIARERMENHPTPAHERRNETITALDARARMAAADELTPLAMPLDESRRDFHRARNVSFVGSKKRHPTHTAPATSARPTAPPETR